MSAGPRRQAEFIGWGSLAELGAIARGLGAASVLLVVDGAVLGSARAEIEEALGPLETRIFSDFATNPKAEEIEEGASICRAEPRDLIVAVGGGTAIDIAKGIRILASGEATLRDLVTGRAAPGPARVPLAAVPTTAGTGSEATQFAVVYIDGRKASLDHPSVRPDYAIVDPSLTETLPAAITATTGMDALAQAMESIWSVASNEESQPDALESLRLSLRHLEAAVLHPTRKDREAMAVAAHLAGRAIDLTRTTAAHSASYPITSRYGVPHGHAVALTLPQMLVFNAAVTDADAADRRGAGAVRDRIGLILGVMGVGDPAAGRERLLALMRAIGLATSVAALGIADIAPILDEGFTANRVGNNPRRIDRSDLAAILLGGDQPRGRHPGRATATRSGPTSG